MRWLWSVAGFSLMGVGIVGVSTPGMPGTVFLIMALYCFFKAGDERMRAKLLNNKQFGPTLRDWEEHKAISIKIKWIACLSIIFSCGFSCYIIPPVWVKVLVASLGLIGIAYILTRKTREHIPAPIAETPKAA